VTILSGSGVVPGTDGGGAVVVCPGTVVDRGGATLVWPGAVADGGGDAPLVWAGAVVVEGGVTPRGVRVEPGTGGFGFVEAGGPGTVKGR
jgi:hypothetical protein